MGFLRRILGTEDPDVQVAGLSGRATIVSLREGGPYINQRPTITGRIEAESSPAAGSRFAVVVPERR